MSTLPDVLTNFDRSSIDNKTIGAASALILGSVALFGGVYVYRRRARHNRQKIILEALGVRKNSFSSL